MEGHELDHELLIRMDEKLKILITEVAILNSTVHQKTSLLENKINVLDKEKLDIIESIRIVQDAVKAHDQLVKSHDDHEKRIRSLEKWCWTAIGALAVLQIVFTMI